MRMRIRKADIAAESKNISSKDIPVLHDLHFPECSYKPKLHS